MMQAIRGRAGSIVVKTLFGLLIISFGYWGIYVRSPFGGSNASDTTVATVGGQSISAEELQRALQPTIEQLRARLGGTLDPQQLKEMGVTQSVLGHLIDNRLLDQEADRLGLAVPDSVIRAAIYENPNFRDPDGRFDRQRFEAILAMNRLSEQQLVADLRHDIPRTDLLQAIVTGVRISPQVVDVIYRYRNQQRLADIVAFPAAAVGNVGPPSAADLKAYYEAHKDLFRAPEYRGFKIASLSPDDVKSSAPIAEDKLHQAWEQRKDAFGKPEERDIEQILAPSEAVAKQAEAALKAGKSWNEVATKIAKQAPDTIDLGLLSQKEILPALGDAAFKSPLNTPTPPIKSPLGWHILRVTKIVPATTLTFAEAKPKLENQLKTEDAVNRLATIGNNADDGLAGGLSLAADAQKFGLKLMTVPAVDQQGLGPDGKHVKLPVGSDDVVKTVFATNEGDTSRVTDTSGGAIFAVTVNKIMPPAAQPLSQVKDKVAADWRAEQRRAIAEKNARALAATVSPSQPLAQAAAAKGLSLLKVGPLVRTPLPGEAVPPELIARLFTAKPGAVVTVNDADGAYTAQLKAIDTPTTVPAGPAASISQQLADEARLDIAKQYTDGLRRDFTVSVNQAVLDRMF
jgi:peptidyl-prolyl cis-trans isomerase D